MCLPFWIRTTPSGSSLETIRLCVMFYDGFLIYASTQEILCKTIKKLRLKAPTDILEPKEGEILKIDRNRPYHYRGICTEDQL